MPYIKQERRLPLVEQTDWPQSAGELNYFLTVQLLAYWQDGPQSYQRINDIMGALEGAKQEFYRRVAVPYEDKKIQENGDVF